MMRTFAFRVGCGFLGALIASPFLVVIAVEVEDYLLRRNRRRVDQLLSATATPRIGRAS